MDGTGTRELDIEGWKARLTRQDQFSLVRLKGHSSAGKYCVVNILEMPPDGMRRAAFSISRRFSKLAVERNRARRLFREVYRRVYGSLPIAWVIFIPRHRMLSAKREDVLRDASRCIQAITGGELGELR